MSPRTHTIIECSEPVLQRLRPWSAIRPSVRVVEGTWQRCLPELGVYDAIFFDDYGAPGLVESEMSEACDRPEYREEYMNASSHFVAFVQICMRWHAHEDTRLSGYLSHLTALRPFSLLCDSADVHLHGVTVDPSPHCCYFSGDVAQVPLFTKCQQAKPVTSALVGHEVPTRCSNLVSKVQTLGRPRRGRERPLRASLERRWRPRLGLHDISCSCSCHVHVMWRHLYM